MPDLLHVIPVGDDAMFDRCFNFEHTALLLSLFTNINFFLVEADHNAGHLRSADYS